MRLILLCQFFISAVFASYAVFESQSSPAGWTRLDKPPNPASTVNLRFYLKTSDDAVQKVLLEVSNPNSPKYGKHLSKSALETLVAPSKSARWSVEIFLKLNGLKSRQIEVSGDQIKVTISLAKAEKLLRTHYYQWKNTEDGTIVTRAEGYSLPKAMHQHVAMVQPTTMFGLRAWGRPVKVEKYEEEAPKSMRVANHLAPLETKAGTIGPIELDESACNATTALKCLTALYGFGNYTSRGHGSIGVTGFLDQFAQFDDMTQFLRKYRPETAEQGNFTVVSVNGGRNIQDVAFGSAMEANLDVQYAGAITYPIPMTYYSVGGRPPFVPDLDVTENNNEPYLEYLEYLLSLDEIPSVISTSYGESEQTVPLSYRHTVCNLFARLGARGTSVIFASGDTGPGWSCRTNDGNNTPRFLPIFPASCPWVTSVGGTLHVKPEQAVTFSSGGFSDTWPAPDYQKSALSTYFSRNQRFWQPWEEYINITGRAFPDVSAQGERYQTFVNDNIYLISGTSAASPAFAGIVALLNDNRISNGGKPLGFLNPLLYSNPQAFTDITKGRSEGCNGYRWGNEPIEGGAIIDDAGVPAGWDAVKGWDPVTGLGTPRFWELAKL